VNSAARVARPGTSGRGGADVAAVGAGDDRVPAGRGTEVVVVGVARSSRRRAWVSG